MDTEKKPGLNGWEKFNASIISNIMTLSYITMPCFHFNKFYLLWKVAVQKLAIVIKF